MTGKKHRPTVRRPVHEKHLSKTILVFALLFFVLAVVLFVQAVLGSILFDFNYTETLVMLGAIFAGLVLLALWRIIDLLEADRK